MRQPATRRPRLSPLVLAAVVPLALLAGCRGDDSTPSSSSTSSASSPSASESASESPSESAGAEAAASPCDSLQADDLEALTGKDLGEGNEGRAGSLPACQWGDPSTGGVQVVDVTAEEWGRQLPALIAQVKASGAFDDARNSKQLRQASKLIESGRHLDGGQACRLFSKLAEIQGNRAGAQTTVTLLPTAQQPQAISAQTCADNRFASVLVIRKGITGTRQEISSVTRALARVTG